MTGHDLRLGRRRFLGLAAGAAVAATGVVWRLSATDGDESPGVGDVAADRPSPNGATETLGRRYLSLVPDEATNAALSAAVPASLAAAAPGEKVDLVDAAVRQDFETGSTIEIDGWLLSLTECRLAALTVVA